jgi:hypothetical protein
MQKEYLSTMTEPIKKSDYRLYKTALGGKNGFVDLNDPAALEQLRNNCNNTDILISTCSYTEPDKLSKCYYPLYITISSRNINDARNSAIEAIYWLTEETGIPVEQMDIYYNGTVSAGENCNNTDKCNGIAGTAAKTPNHSAGIIIYVNPGIFRSVSTEFMPLICFNLARQIIKSGIKNILIDVYEQDHYINLPNSIITTSGTYFIPLQLKELTFLSNEGLAEIATRPRPDDSYTKTENNSEAEDWLQQKNKEIHVEILRQNTLLQSLLKTGWHIPPCIQKLQQLCLYDNVRLEVYRIIATFYAWINASKQQIWHQIQSVDYKNPLNDYQTLKAIITFAIENKRFVGCAHPLLQRFCPAGKCFMAELIEQIEKPYLFGKEQKCFTK